MQAIAPLLALLLADPAPPAEAVPQPVPALLQEALAAADGPGRFRLQPPAGALVGIADGNGDGLQDVVVIASRGRGAWLLPGDGEGTLGAVERIPLPPGAHGVGDLDGDGAPEQLYGGGLGTEAVLVPGKAQEGAAAPALAADFDRDGVLDLVRLEEGVLRVGEERLPVGPETVSLAAADFDADGTLDLVAADAAAEEVSVFLGDAQGGFRLAGVHRVWVRPFSLAAGDLDADGAPDLVVSDPCGGTMSLLRGDGTGSFGTPVVLTQPAGTAPRREEGAPALVKSLTLRPSTLPRAGATATATVQLDAPAPAEGLRVRLRSSDPRLVAPEEEVVVPPGETGASFTLAPTAEGGRAGRLSYLATLTATAAADGSSASATLTVKAP